ncbi:Asp-tRNA(Asn)/Glu-tRNA(Gln) amidotransferase subunit GatB [bacterium]|nr:Asp-tRNA(Asn)/Glu-tRNA(Gln) amidotransferase subunit GatB [bacterium]
MKWEMIAGLEIHAQLLTKTKAFCRCPNSYGDPPNTHVCPVCLGMPGALPVLNKEVVAQATRLALAIGATIHPKSKFDRKNYYYPDLPKGYQISQFDEPFSSGGRIEFQVGGTQRAINITRAHIEEDAGKSMHQEDGSTIVDMNRCGVPLVEIVSEPEFRSPQEAGAYVASIRELLRFIGVCDGNMEEGSLRCDANVSVRLVGEDGFRERTEMKNLNSIRSIERAVQTEMERQIAVYESGGEIHRQTLLWDEAKGELRPMRRKEGSDDYRYFPEPDLVELETAPDFVHLIQISLPELPASRRKRYTEEYALNSESVYFLASDICISDMFQTLVELSGSPVISASFMQSEVQRASKENNWTIEALPVKADRLADLVQAVASGTVSRNQAKDIFKLMLVDKTSVSDIILKHGIKQIGDESDLRALIEPLIKAHPQEVERYRSGKKNLMGFFVGQVMQSTNGQADPKTVAKLVKELLEV